MVLATAIAPDGRRAIAGLENGSLQLFDLITGTPIGQPWQGHSDSVWSVAFAPDGKTVVSGGADTSVALRQLNHCSGLTHTSRLNSLSL